MKVALVMQDTRAVYGAERATMDLARNLRAAGADVRVWLLEEARLSGAGASALAEAFGGCAPVRRFAVEGRLSRGLAAALRRAAEEEGVEVLHSTGYKADVHVAMAAAPRDEDDVVPFATVSTVHGWLFRRWALKERLYFQVNLWALRKFDRVVVLTEFYERLLKGRGFLPLQLARIPTAPVADGIATRAAAEAIHCEERPFTFGLLGRLSDEKNHVLALKAAKWLDRWTDTSPQPWRILVAGDGPLRGALERKARRLGIDDRVEFAGRMEASAFFARTHVLLQPSKVENRPMSILEASAWMRPTVATAAGGMPELVEDGATGRLVAPGDAKGLAEAMRAYWANPALARAHGAAARRWLEAGPTPGEQATAHLEVYRAALKPRR